MQLFVIILLNIWLINGMSVGYQKAGNQMEDDTINFHHQTLSCQRTMTLKQILILLKQQPCAQIIEKQENRQRKKRNTDAGNVDIHALQTTINDHRTMINYLINNSINATFVADAISNHHSKTGPILSSWRDLIDICTVTLFIGFFVYYCICRTGFTPCDNIISFFCKPVFSRTQSQKQQQQEQRPTTSIEHSLRRKVAAQPRQAHSSAISVDGDIVRFNNGYMSE